MKRGFIVFLVICAAAAAMVPRESPTQSRPTPPPPAPTTSTSGKPEICAAHTPCAWSMYKPVSKYIEVKIANSYCVCGPGLVCKINEDDTSVSAYVHRCRLPTDDDFGDS